eukprot:5960786-Alexandrium_andersonii.AAC.1
MASEGEAAMGLATLLMVSCYLRPSELTGLERRSLVAPASCVGGHWCILLGPSEGVRRSKTGATDDSIMVDSEWLQWATPWFAALGHGDPLAPLWPFSHPEYIAQLKRSAAALRLGQIA